MSWEDGEPLINEVIKIAFVRDGQTITNDEGYYSINNVTPGEQKIKCTYITKKVDVQDDRESEINFIFQHGYTVGGNIADAIPVNDRLSITLSRISTKTDDEIVIRRSTDAAGDFEIQKVPPGHYKIVFNTGWPEQKYYHCRYINVTNYDLKLNIKTNNSLFTGRLEGAEEKIQNIKYLRMQSINNQPHNITTRKRDSKLFSFGRVPPGTYNLYVDGTFIKQIEIPEGKDLTDVTITVD